MISSNFLRKKRYRILFYLILASGLIIYLLLYLDSIRFYNLKKTILSIKKPIELVEFDTIFSSISPDNMLNAKLEVISDRPYMLINGFDPILLDVSNSDISKRKTLHPSLNLGIFCMGYASSYFDEHYKNNTLGVKELNTLENIYLYVSKEVLNPFSLNSMTVNDHAISERIQFIMIFSAYLKKFYPNKKQLLNRLSKDFNICLGFLVDKDFFTWQTNHGIMQLRSIAQVSGVVSNPDFGTYLLCLFNSRLEGIIPLHIGNDGAVFEAASGYWLVIYEQLSKIVQLEWVRDLKSVMILEEKLKKTQQFLATIVTNDGFLQGLGDSYSQKIDSSLTSIYKNSNRIFRFSNELVGANWVNDNDSYCLLFVSLNTPPNVHKKPDDLAVYFYYNYPVFINTGHFSYDNTDISSYFRNEKSQSTVIPNQGDYLCPSYSEISYYSYDISSKILKAKGMKKYNTDISIIRKIYLDPQKSLTIYDYSENLDTLLTVFNINPCFSFFRISKDSIKLKYNKCEFILSANLNINISEGVISDKPQSVVPIKRLEIRGNPVKIELLFPSIKIDNHFCEILSNETRTLRIETAKKLNKIYRNEKNDVKKKFALRFVVLFTSIIILIIFFEVNIFRKEIQQ